MPTSPYKALVTLARQFVEDEGGNTAIEYALVSSIVSVGAIAGYLALGDAQETVFSKWTKAVMDAQKNSNN